MTFLEHLIYYYNLYDKDTPTFIWLPFCDIGFLKYIWNLQYFVPYLYWIIQHLVPGT